MKIELPKIKILNNRTYCPMEKGERLLNRIAKTSVPSKQPPNRIVIPTPKPKAMPPRIITNIGLFVKTGKGSNKYVSAIKQEWRKRLGLGTFFLRKNKRLRKTEHSIAKETGPLPD